MENLISQKTVTVTKKEAATRQLDTAIKLFLENRDLISSYTLCCAADGILEGIYKNEREEILSKQLDRLPEAERLKFSWSEEMEMLIKPKYRKEAFQALHAAQNFFKHADRDHNNSYQFADLNLTGVRLLTTIFNYNLIFREITRAMNLYCAFYASLKPELLAEGHPLSDLVSAMPGIRAMSEEFSHEEAAAIGYSALKSSCPELFG